MKKIKTIEAVAAYRTLKALKTSSMSDDAAMRVWKNMKALRHVADTYDKDVEEAQESLKDDKFDDMDYYIEVSEYLKDSGNVFVAYVLTDKADTLRPSDYPTWGS